LELNKIVWKEIKRVFDDIDEDGNSDDEEDEDRCPKQGLRTSRQQLPALGKEVLRQSLTYRVQEALQDRWNSNEQFEEMPRDGKFPRSSFSEKHTRPLLVEGYYRWTKRLR
jgi:hypothetical protein